MANCEEGLLIRARAHRDGRTPLSCNYSDDRTCKISTFHQLLESEIRSRRQAECVLSSIPEALLHAQAKCPDGQDTEMAIAPDGSIGDPPEDILPTIV